MAFTVQLPGVGNPPGSSLGPSLIAAVNELRDHVDDVAAPAWGDITGKPAVIAAGSNEAAARSAIGAGTPYTLPAATTTVIGGVKKTPTVADLATTVSKVNALLAALRTAGIITAS